MSPATASRGATRLPASIAYGTTGCSLGRLLVAASGDGVCAILLGDSDDEVERDLARRFPESPRVRDLAAVSEAIERVIAGVESGRGIEATGLDMRGTEFQRRVWRALTLIPCGETATYREIAESIGAPTATRAVAGACAANPIAIAVPCHRVVRADGSLSGYRWGVERKRELLRRERAAATTGDRRSVG